MRFFRLIVILLLFVGCQSASKETEIVIISINDVHARFDHLDQFSAYVKKIREQHPNVILLNAGDLYHGNSLVDYYYDKGFPIVDIMSTIGFDVVMLGEHEFSYGQSTLARRMLQSSAKNFACANINTDSAMLPNIPPFAFLKRDGVRIGVVGLVQEKPDINPTYLKGIKFYEPIAYFNTQKSLRSECDILIALTHMKFEKDSLLAQQYGMLDLIVGGSSHIVLDTGVMVNNVLITQAGRFLEHCGKTTIKIKDGKIVSRHNEVIDIASLSDRDDVTAQKIAQYRDNPDFFRVVGKLTTSIAGRMNVGNFLCDAIRDRTKTDFAVQNIMGVRTDTLNAGPLSIKDIYQADPFANELVRFETNYKDLSIFLLRNYEKYARVDLCISGFSYTLNVKDGKPISVNISMPDGKPMDKNKAYSLTINSYVANNYDIPVAREYGSNLSMTTVEAIENYMRINREVSFISNERASVRFVK